MLKKKVVFGAALLMIFAGLAIGGYNSLSYNVEIKVGNEKKEVRTFASSVGDVLAEEGIVPGPYDDVNPPLSTPLRDGTIIEIAKAFPVTLVIGEEKKEILTPPVTVSEFLTRQKITLGKDDLISPALTSFLKEGDKIKITRVKKEKITEKEEIPFKVVYQNNSNLASGLRRIIQEGEAGVKVKEIEVVYQNGKEVKRTLLNETIEKEPQDEVIARGTLVVASRGGQALNYERVLNMEATAYGFSAGSVTATGAAVAHGVVAVDPTVIPLGSKLYIEGYGYGRALDVGSSIKGNRIDVFFPSEYDVVNWGRRWVKVYILK